MASLSRHAAVLVTFSLLTGCGGDRSRAGTATDSTSAAAAHDTTASNVAAAPTSDTAVRDTAAAGANDTAKRPTAVAQGPKAAADTGRKRPPAPKPGGKPAATKPATGAKPAAADTQSTARDTAAAKTDSTKTAAAPTPAPQQPDTSTETPLIDAYHQPPHDTVSQAVYEGWKQFNLNCARCHGEDALGTTIAPHLIMSLKPDGPINTKELFVQTVCAGRPAKGMPSWCALGLDMEKINSIYLYVKGRSDAKISPGRPAVKKEG
jgi:cbb3-type cytochrome c oxidase subunit III